MAKMKSTCKVNDKYGVEVGEYAIILENNAVIFKSFEGQPENYEIVSDDSGEIDVTDDAMEFAELSNGKMSELQKYAADNDVDITEVSTSPDDEEEE